MFWCYVLKSKSSGRLYIGQTNNLDDRIRRHNNNQNKATKNRGPWNLIFKRSFQTRSDAVYLEKKLKGFKNPKKVMKWIEAQNG